MRHNDAPQSVGLLWTRDQPVAETSTRQHTTLATPSQRHLPDNTHNTNNRHPQPQTVSGRWDRGGVISKDNIKMYIYYILHVIINFLFNKLVIII